MEIKILKPLKANKQPKNKYKFVIDLMGGDADASFYPEVLVDKNNPYLERFLEFLNNCSKEYPRGKAGDDDYSNVKDYWLFVEDAEFPEEIEIDGKWVEFTEEMSQEYLKEIKKCGISFEWEGSYEFFGESSYVGTSVTYFDENGIEFECKIV